MSRFRFYGAASLAMSVTNFISNGAERVHDGLTVSQNRLE